ncbi:MAG: sulfatase-like hydrolase/transferase [Halioglobus sp.]
MAAPADQPTRQAGKTPNIILIISDDQAWGDYGFMDHPSIQTPNLDQLAASGLVYPRAYVPTSLCRPSLASISTGLYPRQHGITGNGPVKSEVEGETDETNRRYIERFASSPQLAGYLEAAGYRSFQSGKWWEGNYSSGGFTQGMSHGDALRGGRHGDEGLVIGRETMQPLYDFIDEDSEAPFFLWYAPVLPHFPHDAPQALVEKYLEAGLHPKLAAYYATCEWFDETIGQLMDFIETRGLSEDTVILYVGDNGWIQPTQRYRGQPWYLGAPRGKASPYDGGLRTPVIISHPGSIQPSVSDAAISSLDILPTVLRIAGLEQPQHLPGVDLLDAEAVGQRGPVFGAVYAHDMTNIDSPTDDLLSRWVVDNEWKLILPRSAPPELYVLTEDPGELNDIAQQHPEQLRRLTNAIETWWSGPRP